MKWLLFKTYIQIHRALHALGVLPFSRKFGLERGSPVGRYYVERFLRKNAEFVTGPCLEFGDARYRALFPGAGEYHVIDVVRRPAVDFVADIHDPVGVPRDYFKSIICTQVLEHLAHPEKAAAAIFDLLAPGGVLLLTVPFINPVHYDPADFRRYTPEGVTLLLLDAGFDVEQVDFGGNSLVGTGSLLGMVQEDFSTSELELKDPVYPYNVLARARKPASAPPHGSAAKLSGD